MKWVMQKTTAIMLTATTMAIMPGIVKAQDNEGQSGKSFVLQTSPRVTSHEKVVINGREILPATTGGYIVAAQVPGGAVVTPIGTHVDDYNVVDETVLKQGADFIEALGGDPRTLYRYVTVYSSDPNAANNEAAKKTKTMFVFKTEKTGQGFGTTYFNDNYYITYKVTHQITNGEYVKDRLYQFYTKNPQYQHNLYLVRPDGKMFRYLPSSNITGGESIMFGPYIPEDRLEK